MESILIKAFWIIAALTFAASFPTGNQNLTVPSSLNYRSGGGERSGRNLKVWEESERIGNPEEQGTYFEGDIMIHEARNDLDSELWEGGIIPYELRGSFCKSREIS